MSKKKSKKRPSKDQPLKQKAPAEGRKGSSDELQPPDYGGLPDIDLKKNLGCG